MISAVGRIGFTGKGSNNKLFAWAHGYDMINEWCRIDWGVWEAQAQMYDDGIG